MTTPSRCGQDAGRRVRRSFRFGGFHRSPGVTQADQIRRRPIAVETISITKRFGEFVALDGVSLQIARGSIHAQLGENGAGKSTLVKCILGYYQPDQGDVLVDGRAQSINNPRAAHALGLGSLPAFRPGAGDDSHRESRARP